MRKIVSASILSVGALAGLLGAMLVAAEPAEARKMTCMARYKLCNQHCARYGAWANWAGCIQRTCEPQIKSCEGTALVGPKQAANPKQDPKSKGPFSQRPTSGPFVPAGRNPTGGIVPKDRNPTGGIVPGGHIQRIGKR